MEDALVARGWEVALETGAQARPALRQLLRDPDAGLLVVCVPDPVDDGFAAKLRARVDPEGRGDLHIVSLETPRSVIEAVEGLADQPRKRRIARARPRRTYLAHPTLVEQQVGPSRARLVMIGAAATLALALLGVDMRATEASRHATGERPQITPPITRSSSPLVDDAVLSATMPMTSPLGESVTHTPSRAAPSQGLPKVAVSTPPEVDLDVAQDEGIDLDALGPVPLEDDDSTAAPVVTPNRAIGHVPGVRRPYALDPFAGPAALD